NVSPSPTPPLPLSARATALRALERMRAHAMGEAFEPLPGFAATLHHAGHILGAASVHLRCGGRSVLFSGDLGRCDDLVMKPPARPEGADCVLIESTYGNRSDARGDPLTDLALLGWRTGATGGE